MGRRDGRRAAGKCGGNRLVAATGAGANPSHGRTADMGRILEYRRVGRFGPRSCQGTRPYPSGCTSSQEPHPAPSTSAVGRPLNFRRFHALGERRKFSCPWDRLPACQATSSTGWKPIPRVYSHLPLALDQPCTHQATHPHSTSSFPGSMRGSPAEGYSRHFYEAPANNLAKLCKISLLTLCSL